MSKPRLHINGHRWGRNLHRGVGASLCAGFLRTAWAANRRDRWYRTRNDSGLIIYNYIYNSIFSHGHNNLRYFLIDGSFGAHQQPIYNYSIKSNIKNTPKIWHIIRLRPIHQSIHHEGGKWCWQANDCPNEILLSQGLNHTGVTWVL